MIRLAIATIDMILAFAVFASSVLGAESSYTPRQATVKLGSGCSGVCVDPSGIVLTAKHCDVGKTVSVHFVEGGREVQAKRVYVSPEAEGPVVVDCEGGGYPYRPVASSIGRRIPEGGLPVFSLGFRGDNFARYEGELTHSTPPQKNGVRYNVTDYRVVGGNSGGPLFNRSGEVIGIASETTMDSDGWGRFKPQPHMSYWIGYYATRKAYTTVMGEGGRGQSGEGTKPVLVCKTRPGCLPCKEFKQDVKAGKFNQFEVRYEHAASGPVPRFEVNGKERKPAGYHGPRRLLHWIGETLRLPLTVGESIFGSGSGDANATPPNPSRDPEPIADLGEPERIAPDGDGGDDNDQGAGESEKFERQTEPQAELDWSAVTVVLLAAEQDVGAIRGKVREIGLDAATGPIERAIQERTDGKAKFQIVPERTDPKRFQAVASAARIRVSKFYLLALVSRQDIGWIKGKIAGRIEAAIAESDRFADAPIDVIFERVHTDDYAAVQSALMESYNVEGGGGESGEVGEQQAGKDETEQPGVPWYWGLIAALGGAVKKRYFDLDLI